MMFETARRIEDRERQGNWVKRSGAGIVTCCSRELYPDPEAGSIIDEFDGAGVPAHNGTDKAQSETVSRSGAASFEADEPVEHGLSIRVGNTLTAIGHFEDSLFFTAEDADLNLAAARIFEGVVE